MVWFAFGGFALLLLYTLVLWLIMEEYARYARSHRGGYGFLLFCFGMGVRALYLLITPFYLRSYDGSWHIRYVEYVATHWTIPPAAASWEFHQPPLYYFLAAAWARFQTLMLSPSRSTMIMHLQVLSFVFAAAAFIAAISIGERLFPPATQRRAFTLYVLLLALFPGLVFFTSRISNDTLSLALSLVFVALLLAWWAKDSRRGWTAVSIASASVLLTKESGLLLLALLFLLLLSRGDLPWRRKLARAGAAIGIVAILFGWYPLLRFVAEHDFRQTITLGNSMMNPRLIMGNHLADYLTFNPAAMLRLPFNDTWWDVARRRNFWEFFFRSAFFGEFSFEKQRRIAVAILLCGLLALPLLARGMWRAVRERHVYATPLLLTTFLLLAAALAYRWLHPASPNQDFRFSVLLCIPLAFFAVYGALAPPRWWRAAALGVLGASLALWLLFFLSLAIV